MAFGEFSAAVDARPAHGWDPRSCGARCDTCPLGPNGFLRPKGAPWTPVPMERHDNAFGIAVSQVPGPEETKHGYPFAGGSGTSWTAVLRELGWDRPHFDITNTISCLRGTEKVRLADGRLERINKIVKDRMSCEVLSVDAQGRIVPRRIVGWHRTPLGERTLWRVSSVIAKGNPNGRCGVTLTNDHPVLTRRGYVRVDALRDDDEVAVGAPAPGKKGQSVVYGTMLGDGGIDPRNSRLTVVQREECEDFSRLRLAAMRALGAEMKLTDYNQRRDPQHKRVHVISTQASRWMQQVHAGFYRADGSRRIPDDLVLDPLMLAVWYMDDGYLQKRRRNRVGALFHQTAFDAASVAQLCTQLRRLGLDPFVHAGSIYLGVRATRKMAELIAEFIPPSMQYKLPEAYRGRFNPASWEEDPTPQCAWARVVKTPVAPRQPTGSKRKYTRKSRTHGESAVYCIDVEDTHNFLTSDIVVHNCEAPGEPSGAYERMENAVRIENKRLLKLNPKAVLRGTPGAAPGDATLWPHPADACRPRLLRDLGQHTRVFALGGTAAKALLNTEQGIFALQGGPREVQFTPPDGSPERTLQVMPTFHPAFINRARQWWRVWRADVAKALRWWRNARTWKDPHVLWRPTVDEFRAWAQKPAAWHCIDTETSSLYPEVAQLRCITLTAPIDPPETRTCWVCSGRGRVTAAHMRAVRIDWMAALLDAARNALPANYEVVCESCAGRGSAVYDKRAVYLPILGMDGRRQWYSETELAQIKDIMRGVLDGRTEMRGGGGPTGAPIALGHNFVPYDLYIFFMWLRRPGDGWALIESWLSRCRDTIPLARFRGPEMAKALGVVGGELTDIHKWKQDNEGKKLASGARDDEQLGWYGTLDTAVNSDIVRPLAVEAGQKGAYQPCREELKPKAWPAGLPFNLDEMDQVRTRMCLGLRYTGQAVDQAERHRWEEELAADEKKWRAEAIARAVNLGGMPKDFNPLSTDQVAELLYEKFKWAPLDFSELTGKPSTRDEILREHIGDARLPQEERFILKAIRKTRRASKLRSTFCAPCRLMSDDPENGRVWSDGRVHAAWSAGVVAVARLACQGPNLTNVPGKLRSMYVANPGNLQVGADWDQVHLRIIANRWRIGRLLECFRQGLDPHIMLAEDFFGDVFRNAPGWGPDGFSRVKKPKEKGSPADRMRNLAKTIRYQGAYWDIPEGIHKSVTKAEDENGDLVFADFDVREVRRLYEVWMKAEPEWEYAWEWVLSLYEQNALKNGGVGYLEESILNRRSGALEFGKRQAVVNFDILAVEPALMSLAEREVMAAFPFEKWGPGTGMINQCHDAITVEVPEHLARRVDKKTPSWAESALAEAMTIHIPGWEIPFTTEAKAAWRWNET